MRRVVVVVLAVAAGCDAASPVPGSVAVYRGPELTRSVHAAHVPRAVAVGDLDGDGHLDIVTAGDENPPVTVLLAGDFAPITYDGPNATDVATADMDGDGLLDVVTSDWSSVSIYRNLGGGVLGAPQSYGEIGGVLAVADFDRDGYPDVASATFGSLRIMLDHAGTLAPGQLFHPRTGPMDLVAADVNEDGLFDLVTTDFTMGIAPIPDLGETFSVMLGNGDGTFAAPASVQVGLQPYHLALADVDGDHHVDVIVQQPRAIDVFKGAGDGTFALARTTPLTFPTGVFGAIAMGPCTANDCQLYIADTTLDSLQLADPTSVPVTRAGGMNVNSPDQLVVADLDGDGVPEVIAVNHFGP